MFLKRAVANTGLVLTLAMPLACFAVGCGGSGQEAKHAEVKPGEMPAGGDWSGVYYSPTYGTLHLVKEGASVSGKWRTTSGDKWGELHGEVDGDLLKYEWKETTIGMVGPTATKTGKGYFKYVVPSDPNGEHEIKGEWGLGGSDVGNPWSAIKQRNQRPDPDSVVPDETQKVQGEGWDESGGGHSSGGSEGGGEEGGGNEGGGE
jgi:hypothetical protein